MTILVTVGVTGNDKPGVERMVTDQQLVRITTIHGSIAFPQCIGVSLLPIVTSGPDGQLGFPPEVSFISSLVINEYNLSELKRKEKKRDDLMENFNLKGEMMGNVFEYLAKHVYTMSLSKIKFLY